MRHLAALALTLAMAAPGGSAAQAPPAITPDGTLGTLVTRADDAYTISGGTTPIGGVNLFHSFSQFSVPTSGRATFVGDSSIQNVISRVTGGESSTIDGTINTRDSMPSANFFFINPSGVVFGPGAFLDVGGAVRVSTAETIRLTDGVVFSAVSASPEDAPLLTSYPPQAFGFLGSTPGPILLEGANLFVDPGQTLTLLGGDVQIRGGFISAPSGLLQIGAVASPGHALLSEPDLNLGSFARLGPVSISEFAFLLAGTDFILPGGAIVIRGGRLTLDGAVLTAETADSPGPAVGIDLGATESIDIRNFSTLRTQSFGFGDASGIAITGGHLTVSDFSLIESFTFTSRAGAIDVRVDRADLRGGVMMRNFSVAGSAKDITISASGPVTLSGPGTEIATGTQSNDFGVLAGNISLTASELTLSDQATIRSGSAGFGEQGGERINITTTGPVAISSLAGIASAAFLEDVGALEVSASRLTMDAGYITTSTFSVGDAGAIVVNADSVSLTNGAQIASSSQLGTPGSAGSITINSPGAVTIGGIGPADDVGGITFTNSRSSGLFSTAGGTGDAGIIDVNAGSLTLSNGARVDSSTTAEGAGGTINLSASGQLKIVSGARVSADSLGSGFTGDVTLTAGDQIVMTNGSISTRALTSDGGDIELRAPNIIKLSDSQVTTSVESRLGGGGNIRIDPQFMILNGSTITANAFGGPGGSITIVASNFLPSPNSVIQASSALSTPGTVDIESPENNVAGSIAQLPQAFADASRLLRGLCSARRTGAPSSFVVAGHGGVPVDADGYLPSYGAAPMAGERLALAMTGAWDCTR